MLPYSDRAILEVRKLEAYCLNAAHPRGRHKARVFHRALGIGPADASWLREVLLEAARHMDAEQVARDRWVPTGGSMSASSDTENRPW